MISYGKVTLLMYRCGIYGQTTVNRDGSGVKILVVLVEPIWIVEPIGRHVNGNKKKSKNTNKMNGTFILVGRDSEKYQHHEAIRLYLFSQISAGKIRYI